LSGDKSEIYVEFVAHGNVVKATAIDADSGTEATIVGPANAGREVLTQAALRKLKFLLEKKKKKND
jgi:hypothetical protein